MNKRNLRKILLGRHIAADILLTAALLFGTTSICMLFVQMEGDASYTSLIYVLAVLIISWKTSGYLYGLLGSVLAVIAVNYFFTYPFSAMNFSISGYPITFTVFLAVAVFTCTLTMQAKESEQLRNENEKEKMRADLLRSVSHDLRTPLTSILGATNAMLADNDMDIAERRQMLTDIRDESEWLVHMVENLLTVTRISGSANIKKEEWPVEEVVGEAAAKIHQQNPGVEVDVHVPDEILFVPMDAVLIEQVLLNLMNNSVRHGQNTTKIIVSVEAEENDARFTVCDNGAGFSEEYLSHLFDRKFLEEHSAKSQDTNKFIGIGLSACKAVIQAHGGQIAASNVEDPETGAVTGATVTFTLPRS